MTKLEVIFPEKEVIDFIKGFELPQIDQSKLSSAEYADDTYNPFDVNFNGTIILNNGVIIDFSKIEGGFEVKVGKNSGWIGGISWDNILVTFSMKEFTLKEFRLGFKEAIENPRHCLITKYGSGSIDRLVFMGTLEEIDTYAKSQGYEKKINEYTKRVYYTNANAERWGNDRLFYTYILTDDMIKIFNNKVAR